MSAPTRSKSLIEQFQLRSHASAALLSAAIADQQLQDALLSKMRTLTRALNDELFTGYGPLSSLSSKIALAYALGLLDSAAHKRLTIARQIRNRFAHANELITFESPEIQRLLCQFPNDCDQDIKNEFLYLWHMQQVEAHLVSTAGPQIRKSTEA